MTMPNFGYTGDVPQEDAEPLEKALETPAPGEVPDLTTGHEVAEQVAAQAEAAPDTPPEALAPPLPAVTTPAPAPAPLGASVRQGAALFSVPGAGADPNHLASILPKKKTVVSTDFAGKILLVYGPPKIGKSELASQFPNPIFIATEEGHAHLQIYKYSVAVWPQFVEIVQALIMYRDQVPYKTVVVDTVDLLFDYCLHHYCSEKGIQHPSDEGYGKGWEGLRLEWQKGISALVKAGYTVVFISHAKERTVVMHGIERDIVIPSMSNTAAKVVKPSIDYIVALRYCSKEESVDGRKMVLRGDETIEAGDRSGFFSPEIAEISYKALHRDYVENVVPALKAKFNITEPTKEVESE